MSFNIAIDGPAGAAKSTIAKALAKKISFLYVDTGAMYRAMAYYFLQHQIDPDNGKQIADACSDIQIELKYLDQVQQVFLNGTNITEYIRAEEVGNMASATSGYPVVREKLLLLQKQIASATDVIMDGRDIGTTVLPNAQLKVYLTASVQTRASRRFEELKQKGISCNLNEIESDISKRDKQDMERNVSPLRQAEDAVLVDSSDMTITDVVEHLFQLAVKAGYQRG